MKKQRGSKSDNGGGIIKYDFPKGQIMFNVEEVTFQDPMMGDVTQYAYDYAECSDIHNEDRVIENIIRSRYSQDDVEAIFANHLLDSDDDSFAEFQRWRKVAKVVARKKIYDKKEIDKLI